MNKSLVKVRAFKLNVIRRYSPMAISNSYVVSCMKFALAFCIIAFLLILSNPYKVEATHHLSEIPTHITLNGFTISTDATVINMPWY